MTETEIAKAAEHFQESSLLNRIRNSRIKIIMVRSDSSGIEIIVPTAADATKLETQFGLEFSGGLPVKFISEDKSFF